MGQNQIKNCKDCVSDQSYGDTVDEEDPDDEGESSVSKLTEEQKVALSSSRTRSGRVSRPPLQIDEAFNRSSSQKQSSDSKPSENTPESGKILFTLCLQLSLQKISLKHVVTIVHFII